MSFCRWSSNDYQCDAYVWADCGGGYRTEIAGRRRVWDVELPPNNLDEMPQGDPNTPERVAFVNAWLDRWSAVDALLRDESNWHWIALPEPPGGQSYHHDTADECADNLERLRGHGFMVPQGAIDDLRAEGATDILPGQFDAFLGAPLTGKADK